jgi:hypothetical protein
MSPYVPNPTLDPAAIRDALNEAPAACQQGHSGLGKGHVLNVKNPVDRLPACFFPPRREVHASSLASMTE